MLLSRAWSAFAERGACTKSTDREARTRHQAGTKNEIAEPFQLQLVFSVIETVDHVLEDLEAEKGLRTAHIKCKSTTSRDDMCSRRIEEEREETWKWFFWGGCVPTCNLSC